jgi:hypothetical protein
MVMDKVRWRYAPPGPGKRIFLTVLENARARDIAENENSGRGLFFSDLPHERVPMWGGLGDSI